MQVNLENKKEETNYEIKLSNDSRVECSISHKFVSIIIDGTVFHGVPIHFDSLDFDIILEMIWLCTSGFKIGCDDPKVISREEQRREICFMVKESKKKPYSLNTVIKQVSSYVKDILCIGVMLLTFNLRKKKQKTSL